LYTKRFNLESLGSTTLPGVTVKPVPKNLRPTIGYVAPFATFVGILELEHIIGTPPQVGYPIRVALTLIVLWLVSRPYIQLRPSHPIATIGIGLAVFAIWIGPDAVFPHWHGWARGFSALSGGGSMLPGLLKDPAFLIIRAGGSTLLVPIIEELFWRAWVMRWLIHDDFQAIPLGTYVPWAFWVTAALFAAEHGAYWDVGLAAGAIYNWWMVRSKSLADCILAHAVTNGTLAVYVIISGAWQFWQ
jgi:uncharacterized protein